MASVTLKMWSLNNDAKYSLLLKKNNKKNNFLDEFVSLTNFPSALLPTVAHIACS